MAENEDSVMIFFLVCFLVLFVVRLAYSFARHLDRQELERKKFYLALADDLRRMDKMIAEGNKPEPMKIQNPWAGRN
jgi:hypothetical protein